MLKKTLIPTIISSGILIAAILTEFSNPIYYLSNDFCIEGFQATSNAKINNEIVIVNISDFSAKEIKDQIDILSRYHPSVIGVDFYSNVEPSTDTSRIRFNKLVLPILIDSSNKVQHAKNIFTKFAEYGFITVYSSSFFEPFIEIDEKVYTSLPVKILELHDYSRYGAFLKREIKKEIINYAGNTSDFIYLGDLTDLTSLEVLQKIRGKIVLLGYTGIEHFTPTASDDYDAHNTPKGKMFGVVILANIINTLMGEYITPLPIIVMTVVVLFVALANTIIPTTLYTFRARYWIIKAIQLAELALGFAICSFVMHEFKMQLDYQAIALAIIVAPEVSYWFSVKNKQLF